MARVDYGELERAKAILLEMYYEKGYRFADVTYRFEPTEQGDQRVVFTADTGEKVKIEEIDFEGNTVFSDTRLKFMLRKTRESGPISAPLKRNVYNPANFEEDLDRVRDLYREQGYKNITILEPEIDIRAKSPNDESKRRLYMTIPIDEGTRWRFGEITIEGNEVFSDELLLGIFDRPRGEWLKASAIDEGVEAIGEIYRNSGYVYSRVESELREREDGVADVFVKVFEGDQYRVGRLEFEGNTRTKDKVLRREFRVQEGMVLNMGGVKNSLFKVNQLGYFTLDENNPVEFENFDQEEKTVDLVVRGEESDRTELLFGGGWSELDGFFAQLSLRNPELHGSRRDDRCLDPDRRYPGLVRHLVRGSVVPRSPPVGRLPRSSTDSTTTRSRPGSGSCAERRAARFLRSEPGSLSVGSARVDPPEHRRRDEGVR